MRYLKIFFIVGISLLGTYSFAQTCNIEHFLRYNPEQMYTNPSVSTCDVYFALPVLGDLRVGIYNPTFRYGKLFETEDGYPIKLKSQDFVSSLSKKNNWLNFDFSTEILGFGFRVKEKLFLSFDYRIKANMAISASKDLFGVLLLGNLAYTDSNNPADINMQMQINAYRELSVGAQYELNEHLSFGARQKIIFGLLNVNSRKIAAQLYTDPNSYDLYAKYQVDMNAASVFPYFLNTENGVPNFGFGQFSDMAIGGLYKNFGLGWDLSAQYRFDDRFTLTATALDLGFIRWNTNTTHLEGAVADNGKYYNNGNFVFTGFDEEDLEDVISNKPRQNQVVDTIFGYFPLNTTTDKSYTTGLATRLMLQFDYNLTEMHRFSALVQAYRAGNTMIPSLTVAYSGSFTRWVDLCVAYTIKKNSYDNLGIGLGFNLKVVTIFAACENIIPAINRTRLSNPNVHLGIVFNWDKKQK